MTVTVTNKGEGAADGTNVLITPSLNLIQKGKAVASRGPGGCSGVAVIDCDIGRLSAGATAQVRLQLRAASGPTLFVGATAQRSGADATPADDTGTLTVKVLPSQVRFTVSATAGRIAAGEQYALPPGSRPARPSPRKSMWLEQRGRSSGVALSLRARPRFGSRCPTSPRDSGLRSSYERRTETGGRARNSN